MPVHSYLYANEVKINDYISVKIPTVGEVIDHEESYYAAISVLTATPYDVMVQLDDLGIDFSTVDDFDTFMILFPALRSGDTSLVFGELNLSRFVPMVNPQNDTVVLRDVVSGATIDRSVYTLIASALRKIHHLKRTNKKPGNEEAKKYMIERARKKMRRRKTRDDESQLEDLIVALVNTEQFHYNFSTVRELTIYQFNQSVQQVVKKIDFDNRMHGVYAGTVSTKDLRQEDLTWLTYK